LSTVITHTHIKTCTSIYYFTKLAVNQTTCRSVECLVDELENIRRNQSWPNLDT
jgi:hypothetical protein